MIMYPLLQCSKPCGGGDMTRKVICMKDNVTVPTSSCDVESIMFGKDSCNIQPCGEGKIIRIVYCIK